MIKSSKLSRMAKRDQVQRFSIRKFSLGVASALVSVFGMLGIATEAVGAESTAANLVIAPGVYKKILPAEQLVQVAASHRLYTTEPVRPEDATMFVLYTEKGVEPVTAQTADRFGILPATGSQPKDLALLGIGLGVLSVAGYLVYRHQRTGRLLYLAILVAGGVGFSLSPGFANQIDSFYQELAFYMGLDDYEESQADAYSLYGYIVFEKEQLEVGAGGETSNLGSLAEVVTSPEKLDFVEPEMIVEPEEQSGAGVASESVSNQTEAVAVEIGTGAEKQKLDQGISEPSTANQVTEAVADAATETVDDSREVIEAVTENEVTIDQETVPENQVTETVDDSQEVIETVPDTEETVDQESVMENQTVDKEIVTETVYETHEETKVIIETETTFEQEEVVDPETGETTTVIKPVYTEVEKEVTIDVVVPVTVEKEVEVVRDEVVPVEVEKEVTIETEPVAPAEVEVTPEVITPAPETGTEIISVDEIVESVVEETSSEEVSAPISEEANAPKEELDVITTQIISQEKDFEIVYVDDQTMSVDAEPIVEQKGSKGYARIKQDVNQDGVIINEEIIEVVEPVNAIVRRGTAQETVETEVNSFTVDVLDVNGNVIGSALVEEGQNFIPPVAPEVEGFVFERWSEDTSNILGNMTIRPIYKAAQFVEETSSEEVVSEEASEETLAPSSEEETVVEEVVDTPASEENVEASSEEALSEDVAEPVVETEKPQEETLASEEVTQSEEQNTSEETASEEVVEEVKDITVSFQMGDQVVSVTTKPGEAVDFPEPAVIEGKRFLRWSVDNQVFDADATVVAQYATINYTVTFVGEDGRTITVATVPHGGDVKDSHYPADPVKEGYTFTGWSGQATGVTSDTVLTATYDKVQSEVTVSFVGVTESGATLLPISTATFMEGEEVVYPTAPAKEGYKFVGWKEDTAKASKDLVLEAVYAQETYNVLLLDENGSLRYSRTVAHGATTSFDITQLKKTGYTLTGLVDSSGKVYTDASAIPVTSNLELSPVYDINKYTVKFFDEDGNLLKEQGVKHGGMAFAPTAPAKDGYDFVGWSKDYIKVYSNLNIYPRYQEQPKVSEPVVEIEETKDMNVSDWETVHVSDSPYGFKDHWGEDWNKESVKVRFNQTLADEYTVLYNEHIASIGKRVPQVVTNQRVIAVAQERAKELLRHYGHTLANGESYESVFVRNGLPDSLGENLLAGGWGKVDEAHEALNSWLNSPGHKRNMEKMLTYSHQLTVVMESDLDENNYYWVQLFFTDGLYESLLGESLN